MRRNDQTGLLMLPGDVLAAIAFRANYVKLFVHIKVVGGFVKDENIRYYNWLAVLVARQQQHLFKENRRSPMKNVICFQ